MNINTEFPDYPMDSLPDLTGFEDTSWHNDTCPSFKRDNFHVWVDWPDVKDRECQEGTRFVVCKLDNEGYLTNDYEDVVVETDDWSVVLAYFTKE